MYSKSKKTIPKTDYSDDGMHYFSIYQSNKQSQRERPLLQGLEKEVKFCESRRFRCDFADPHKKLGVECDGGQWLANGGRHNRDSDREKLNIAAPFG
jgi:very-short-patch-repair endonuclease